MMADASDDLVARYRAEAAASIEDEAASRRVEMLDPAEELRLRNTSLRELVSLSATPSGPWHADLVPALLSRLGAVRVALEGHGGGLCLESVSISESEAKQDRAIESPPSTRPFIPPHMRAAMERAKQPKEKGALILTLSLEGACVSCGAAAGTLQGVTLDLQADPEIMMVKFSEQTRSTLDELSLSFLEHFSSAHFGPHLK